MNGETDEASASREGRRDLFVREGVALFEEAGRDLGEGVEARADGAGRDASDEGGSDVAGGAAEHGACSREAGTARRYAD